MSSNVSRVRKKGAKKDEGLWLLSFCDLSFVLMSFFVLLLSWSKIDRNKIEHVSSSMQNESKSQNSITTDRKDPQLRGQENLKTLERDLEQLVQKLNMKQVVDINYTADGLSIEFKDQLLFASGSARSQKLAQKSVDEMMKVIASSPKKYALVIEGYTDDLPIVGGEFKNNWELSSARALTLLQQFKSKGVSEDRMRIVSYAHTHPKVNYVGLKGPKLTEARNANRRVVVRIE